MASDTSAAAAATGGRARRRRLGAAALGLLLMAGGLAAGLGAVRTAAQDEAADDPARGNGDAVPPMTVRTQRVQPQDSYRIARTFLGEVEAARQSRLGFELRGKLARVAVDEGEPVAAGAVVAELDTARLQARRRELEAALERAEADRALAESTLTRVREATEQRAASAQRLDEAKQSLAAARARVNEVTAQLDSIDVDLDKSVLRAPYAGIVARRHVDEGDVVAAGAPVVKLLEQADPEVRIGVDANAAEGLRVGDVHPLTIRGRQVDAAVEAVLPQRADGSRTVEARFVITGRLDGRIRAGDVAELTLDRRVTAEGVWLPLDALTESARGLWAVYVAADRPSDAPAATDAAQDTARDATRTLRRADVELLHHTGERVFVRGPFDGRTRVVVDGLHRLVPGQTVRLAAPESPGPNDGSGGVPQSARVGDASSGDLDRE